MADVPTLQRSAEQYRELAVEALDLAFQYTEEKDDSSALVTLLAGVLSGLTHMVTLLEAQAVHSGAVTLDPKDF